MLTPFTLPKKTSESIESLVCHHKTTSQLNVKEEMREKNVYTRLLPWASFVKTRSTVKCFLLVSSAFLLFCICLKRRSRETIGFLFDPQPFCLWNNVSSAERSLRRVWEKGLPNTSLILRSTTLSFLMHITRYSPNWILSTCILCVENQSLTNKKKRVSQRIKESN